MSTNNGNFQSVLEHLRFSRDLALKAKEAAEEEIRIAEDGIRAIEKFMARPTSAPTKAGEPVPEVKDESGDDEYLEPIEPSSFALPTTTQILNLLKQNPGKTFTVAEIRAGISPVSVKTFHGALWRLSSETHRIQNVSRGRYRIRRTLLSNTEENS